MKKTRLGIIGLGNRGFGMLKGNFIYFDEVEFTAMCDTYPDRVERAQEFVKEKRGNVPFGTTDYNELLARDDVDAVYVSTAWEWHIEISIAAMKAGKAVAMEVGGSYSIDECFDLVRTYEETKTPFIFMENCCYNRDELLATSMARAGMFGTIVHCMGSYSHDLREEITHGNVKRHYRLRNYMKHNCDNYPTHDLGPIARVLGINRGNRMVSLVSVASKAAGLKEYIKNKPELVKEDPSLENAEFMQGDVVTTIIKCAGGETITLRLDTTLPRSYTRDFTIRGTKGMYEMNANYVYLDGMPESWKPAEHYAAEIHNAKKYEDEFLPDVWYNMTEEDMKRGHGGMDYILFREFLRALNEGREMPIDVYDAASWMCISALSEASIALGGMPQSIPDFTNGKWIVRENKPVIEMARRVKPEGEN